MQFFNKYKIVCFLIALSCWMNSAFGQQKAKRLKDGDLVPDIEFPVIINSKMTHAKLSDFRGKIVVLDYWSLWCGSCIQAMPEVAHLQQKFKNDVVILAVSFLHKKDAIEKFVEKKKSTPYEVKLPLAIFESTNVPLFKMLPTDGYPHGVFIDRDGKLVQTVIGVDSLMLERVIKGEKTGYLSNDYQVDFKRSAPMLLNGNGGPDTAYIYRSMITGYRDSLRSYDQSIEFEPNRSRILYINMPVLELEKCCLREGLSIDPSDKLTEFVGVERSRFVKNADNQLEFEKWLVRNTFCYELILPPTFDKKQAFAIMHEDIDRYFNLNTSIQNKLKDCYVLVRIDTIDRIKTKTSRSVAKRSFDGLTIECKKISMEYLTSFLSERRDDPIVLDETGYKDKIDIDIKTEKQFDAEKLNLQLKRYGLELKAAKRNMDVAVIKNRRE